MYAGVAALFRARAIRLGAPRLSAAASSPNIGQRRTQCLAQRSLHLSASSPTTAARGTAAQADSKDGRVEETAQVSEITQTNLARNNEIRQAYRHKTPETEAAVTEMLGTTYIPPARQYPTAEATALSLQRARLVARIRVGEETLAARTGRAADELIAVCRDVEVYRLGEVTTLDYAARRLWPAIEDADDGGAFVPADQLDNIWFHREQQYWIDCAYEKLPQPTRWTQASFDTFIRSIVYGRLKPGMTLPIYHYGIHTDNIRVRMIMEAFEDPAARSCITTPVLQMALQFMATHGGHRASAERLLAQAERWGVPLDTDAFNILLACYAQAHDARFFHKVLVKMRERCFYPNTRTWLHFLQLVQRDDARLQVEAAMFDLGFFADPGTRRGVGIITAGAAAYQAFRAGETLASFLRKQIARFGPAWLTEESVNAVLSEFFLFHPTAAASSHHPDHRVLVERLAAEQGRPTMPSSTRNLILEHCAQPHVCDWDTALPAALAVVVFYAVKERALVVRAARTAVAQALLDKGDDAIPPRLLSPAMARAIQKAPVEVKAHAVRAVEAAMRHTTEGYMPADRLVDVLRDARTSDYRLQREGTAAAAAAAAAAKTEDDGAAAGPMEPEAVTIALEGTDGASARTEVRLDRAFDVRRMVVYNQHAKPAWLADKQKKKKQQKRSKESETASGQTSEPALNTTVPEKETKTEEAAAPAAAGEQGGNHPLVQYVNSLH
ncbi:pentatricopeptide repeat domain-containing protein [Beauveria brongniartii RCEF 3172]|uniref:Pentatricopeptide repeat domain-containing protein n=1 Tax=Beauveria brongniartii RCEF 3172 TaxID=1081107 RepID=A0A162I284_9HYPO|nr:pentatricopeptide repeat domain-containing protein [Beauveria brongniartii RCEF 3172]